MDFFRRFTTKTTSYLHLGRFKGGIKDIRNFYLYSITKDLPEKIETL